MKHGNRLCGWIRRTGMTGLLLFVGSTCAGAQESAAAAPPASAPPADSLAGAVQDLQTQVRDLRTVVEQMRAEAAESRAESAELRRELQATRSQLAGSTAPEATPPTSSNSGTADSAEAETAEPAAKAHHPSLSDGIAALEESSQLLGDKIDEQYQTKVESASKYRMRLSGIVLLNLFDTRGTTDNVDFPSYASAPSTYLSGNSFGATMRQSELGVEVFGPRLAGARASGSFQADFAGGFPANAPNAVDAGVFRLQVASMRMDWEHTSIVAGQDALFLSPRTPTSFASLALPAFSYAGNLWGWIPQVRVEHHIELSDGQELTVQGGILDNLTGEPPFSQNGRTPDAGENSGQPAYAGRVAWRGSVFGEPVILGAAGYYSPQEWGYGRRVDGWAGMTDWEIPFSRWVSLSGEFYRGKALGGLGGGIGRSVLYSGSLGSTNTLVRGLNATGGWSQLKFRASSKLEFNGAFGIDNAFASDLRAFPAGQSYLDPTLARNYSSLVNFIYRPRSNLLFSTEYRHLQTFHIDDENYPADQVNLVMGILF